MKYVFLSAELSKLTQTENETRTKSLYKILKGLELLGMKITKVNGVYNGTSEVSFKVDLTENVNVEFFKFLGKQFGQESILWVDRNNRATLHYLADNRLDYIGVFQRIEDVQGLTAYSEIDGQFYACVA